MQLHTERMRAELYDSFMTDLEVVNKLHLQLLIDSVPANTLRA